MIDVIVIAIVPVVVEYCNDFKNRPENVLKMPKPRFPTQGKVANRVHARWLGQIFISGSSFAASNRPRRELVPDRVV